MGLLRFAMAGLGLAIIATAPSQAMDRVGFASRDGTMLSGLLAKPEGPGPFPAVVAMHGCSGLWTGSGRLNAREADWTQRLVAAGYAVLLPDSFRPRGLTALCNDRERSLTPRMRAQDALGAADFLAAQPFGARGRTSLLGWSNGGSTVLHVAGSAASAAFHRIIAFYPGCRVILKAGWRAQVPTTILHGLADDWTPAAPCAELAAAGGARFIGYPGAFHNFDHPNLPLRERKAAYSQRPDGLVTIGTDAGARQQAMEETLAILGRP